MNGVDFLYQHLTYRLVPEYIASQVEAGEVQKCVCCGRPNDEWLDPYRYVVGESYGKKEIHCLSCHALYHGSFDRLGHEGYRGKTPTSLKLGMLPGAGALITPSQAVIYAPGKYHPKFSSCKGSIFDEIVALGGKDITYDVLARELKPPFLFIKDFGRKKASLVSNLIVSTSEHELVVCEEGGVTTLPTNFPLITEALDSLPKKEKKELVLMLRRSTQQLLSNEAFKRMYDLIAKAKGLKEHLLGLSDDPHERLKLFLLLEA